MEGKIGLWKDAAVRIFVCTNVTEDLGDLGSNTYVKQNSAQPLKAELLCQNRQPYDRSQRDCYDY